MSREVHGRRLSAGRHVLAVPAAVLLLALGWRGGPVPSSGPPAPAESQPDAAGGLFREVASEAGLDFAYRNGAEAGHLSLLEVGGGGVAVLDYDGDGLLDVFLAGGGHFDGKEIRGHPNRLFKN